MHEFLPCVVSKVNLYFVMFQISKRICAFQRFFPQLLVIFAIQDLFRRKMHAPHVFFLYVLKLTRIHSCILRQK